MTFTVAGATKPVVGDWDGDGDDNVGVVKAGTYPNPDTWYLDTDGSGGAAERTLLSPTSLSNLWVAGDWDNDGDDNIGGSSGSSVRIWSTINEGTGSSSLFGSCGAT